MFGFLKTLKGTRQKPDESADWQSTPLGASIARHVQEYFTKFPRLAELEQERKRQVIEDFFAEVGRICSAENPFMAMRQSLASDVCALAELQVLCLTEDEKPSSFVAQCPYVSGELHHHIVKAAEYVPRLKELVWKHPAITKDELVSVCNSRTLLSHFYIYGINLIRIEFNDYDSKKDWLAPFIKAMLISYESDMRNKLGLPLLLPDAPLTLDALIYSGFMNLVITGDRSPWFQWDQTLAKDLSAPSVL